MYIVKISIQFRVFPTRFDVGGRARAYSKPRLSLTGRKQYKTCCLYIPVFAMYVLHELQQRSEFPNEKVPLRPL